MNEQYQYFYIIPIPIYFVFVIVSVVFVNTLYRCYNCGDFANHIAAKCTLGPMPKRCHSCKAHDHLIADCPKAQSKEGITKFSKTPRKKSERQKSSRPKSTKPDEGSVDDEKTTVLPDLNGDEIDDKNEKNN